MKFLKYIINIPKGVIVSPNPPLEGGNIELAMSVIDIVRKYDYPLEIFPDVITQDGYILELHRIPHGRNNPGLDLKGTRPPVLLMHGIISSSADFVMMGPKRGLAFLLADMGYDVWLGNARGNTYSCRHLELNPKKDKHYWRFSWHEIGIYDLPAMFELIQKVTGYQKFAYIGMSQGNTAFFVCLSELPQYNQCISVMIALAPVVFLEHFYSPVPKRLASLQKYIGDFVPKDFPFPPPFMRKTIQVYNRMYCQDNRLYRSTSTNLLFSVIGDDPDQLNEEDVAKIFSKLPNKSSARQFFHYGQCIGTGNFRKFDYGSKKNLRAYGQSEPPPYKLQNITTPVALCYGKGDWFARHLDVFRLSKELANCVSVYKVRFYTFNHYDYIVACDVHKLLYEHVFSLLRKYN